LIDLGVELNVRDIRGRVPLHYAFVKLRQHGDSTPIDPIETVSSLCARKELEIEVPDKWNKTPLHYAAQRSATISSLYILQRGALIESKDIYGNTALGVALMKSHFNFGIILIQKLANVTGSVYDEFPKRIAKMWKDAEKEARRKAGEDVEMEESDDEKKHRNMFKQDPYSMANVMYRGSDSDSESGESDSDESSDHGSDMEFNVMTS